jgi:multimeric flavodoxin WrbA
VSIAIVLGTARPQGNTYQLAQEFARQTDATFFHLDDHAISAYDYGHHNRGDDFLPLMRRLLAHDHILLASPMYWYAPSSSMKVFLDRLSDLMTIEKDMGRQLRGKYGGLLATGADPAPPSCFEEIFQRTMEFLGMRYQGMLYCHCVEDFIASQHQVALSGYAQTLQEELAC